MAKAIKKKARDFLTVICAEAILAPLISECKKSKRLPDDPDPAGWRYGGDRPRQSPELARFDKPT